MGLSEAVRQARVAELPVQWVDGVWQANFIDTADSLPLPVPITTKDLGALADAFIAAHSDAERFWEVLVEEGAMVRAILPLLHHFMDECDTEAAMLAATAYCAMLNVNGAGAHSAFNPMLFRASIKILDRWVAASDGGAPSPLKPTGTKRVASSPLNDGHAKRRAGRGPHYDSDGYETDTCVTEMSTANPDMYTQLMKQFSLALSQLNPGELLDETVQLLVRATRMPWAEDTDPIRVQLETPKSPSAHAYVGLCTVFMSSPEAELAVCHNLLSSVTMRYRSVVTNGAAIPRAVHLVRATSVDFIIYLVDAASSPAPLKLFMQHCCTKVPDKAEYRVAVAAAVAKIFGAFGSKFPEDVLALSAWVIKLSRNGRVGYRNFATELLGCLLRDGVAPTQLISQFVGILVSRCSDKAAGVRTRAISTLAAVAESGTPTCTAELAARATAPSGGLGDVMLRRTCDEKAGVRKAALQGLEIFASAIQAFNLNGSHLKAFVQACNDTSINVRKQAMSSLTILLERTPTDTNLQEHWLDAIMPLVIDGEESVRARCTEQLQTYLVSPIAGGEEVSPEIKQLGWSLLALVDTKQDLRRYLQRVCMQWQHAGVLSRELYINLGKHLSDPAGGSGGWALLSEIAGHNPTLVDIRSVSAAWAACSVDDLTKTVHLLSIIGVAVARFPTEMLSTIADTIRARLLQFTAPVSTVSSMMHCLAQIDSGSSTTKFFERLLLECEKKLAAVAFSGDGDALYDEVAAARQVFTFGEAALVWCPASVTKRHVLIIQALIAPIISRDGNESNGSDTPSAHPPSVRAHAFLTLGKLCLQDEELAKQTIASMAQELEICSDPAVRNNIVVVITDLCVRHPNVIQQYLPNIALCLKDGTALVRRQTITLLTRLLKEDFIKLRGSLVFRLLMTVVDSDESVRDLARFCVVNILKVKDAALFFTHFVECIFHFNSSFDHQVYNRFPQRDIEIKQFTLAGNENAVRRHQLYSLMLQHCSDVERIKLTQKLCQEVLGAVADGSLPYTDTVQAVLSDTMKILAGSDIKVDSRCGDDEDDARAIATAKAKKALVSKIMRKNTVDNIVPIVIALKGLLEYKRSPLMRELMLYLREIMRDFKEEVAEIMAADKQLANEIQFDLRKFEDEQRKTEAAEIAKGSPVVGTPHLSLVRPGSAQSLRGPTPTGSPLLSPSLFTGMGSPGSPAFAAPKLRPGLGMNVRRKSRGSTLSKHVSASALTPKPSTPIVAVTTPATTDGNEKDVLLTSPEPTPAHTLSTGVLAWVRTPVNKRVSLAATSADSEVIHLNTPGLSGAAPRPQQWNVAPPDFVETDGIEKRNRDIEDDLTHDEQQNENVDSSNSSVAPPQKKPSLTKAQLRQRKVELSKLSVKITEKKMLLEQLVADEKFYEAESAKAEIDKLCEQKAALAI